MENLCKNCGKTFKPLPGRPDSKYCSRQCYYSDRWGNRLLIKKCLICGIEFTSHPSDDRKYCSRNCCDKRPDKKGRPRNRSKKKCDWCGKEFERPVSNFHSKHFFCCHSCSAKWWAEYGLHGDKHPKWNGGQYQMYTDGWKIVRRKALKRANNMCQICHAVGRLEVHHIKPVNRCLSAKEANCLSNVIVVCPTCHAVEEKKSRKKYPQLKIEF